MSFRDAMRRVITGDNASGKSTVILDGGPSAELPDTLFEIWEETASGALDPHVGDDLGPKSLALGPGKSKVRVRWFTVAPPPDALASLPKEAQDHVVREMFGSFGAAGHIVDQTRHPMMHETPTLDIVCVLQGELAMILEEGETILKPGNVVIQRGTNHAWHAVNGPALLLAVLIDRSA